MTKERNWPLFVANFLLSERKLVRGKKKELVLHLLALEWLGLIDRKYARECLQ